jgi:hypothetical protein
MRAMKWCVAGLGLLLGSLLAVLSTSSAAHASLVEALDLAGLVDRADEVVVARVMTQNAHYDDHGRIVTDVDMLVEQTEKGNTAPGAMITLRRLGGVVGDIGMRVEGEPAFDLDEVVLLFGSRDAKRSVFRPVGMSQGALRIKLQNGERWVQSIPMGAALVTRTPQGTLGRAAAAVSEPRKLADVITEIRALIKTK